MEKLTVASTCLMFFVDETGNEVLADPSYPIFGLGGCAIQAGRVRTEITQPWRVMKDHHFGDPDIPLHAADHTSWSSEQLEAIGRFFKQQRFARFATIITASTKLPKGCMPYDVIAGILARRWQEVASRCQPPPTEIAFIFESSHRGDRLVQKYIGSTRAHVNGTEVAVHKGLMAKAVDDSALEVADFVIHAAGAQARRNLTGFKGFGKDFQSVFHVHPALTNFMKIDICELEGL